MIQMTDLITKLYKIQIDCSTYEPQIDSDDTEITITLLDFNNEPVSNEEVTVTCSGGLFWYVKRSQTDQNAFLEEVSTVTIRTNDNGQFILGYWANEWGFINIQANNTNIKLYVTGWKEISLRLGIEYDYWSKTTTNGDREFKGSTTSGAINPCKNTSMKYDDSIGVIQYSFGYNNNWNTNLQHNEDNYPIKIFTDAENANSKIPSHLLTTLPRPFGYRWYRPDVVYFIKTNGELDIFPYNESSSSHIVSPAPADDETINIERMYWSEVMEL